MLRRFTVIAATILALATSTQPATAHPRVKPGQWKQTGSLHVGRIFPTATVLQDGRVLVTGGEGPASSPAPIASAELYSPRTRKWTLTGSMNTPRVFQTATLLNNGKVLVTGGRIDASNETNTAELFDPSTGTWTGAANMSIQRAAHTATLLANGKVLVAGGQTNTVPSRTPTAEIYDPATNTWTPTTSMSDGRYQHTATLLTNGRVLVAGGLDNTGQPTATAELYNPANGSWANTASMDTPRYTHAAVRTLLPNGKVLVSGGANSAGPFTVTPTAELFDPSGTWSPTTTFMVHARYLHTATLLPDGKVLVAGGQLDETHFNAVTATAELFDPTTGVWSETGSLNTLRVGHAAVLIKLAHGHRRMRVLVVGGTYNAQEALTSTELYALPRH